MRLIFQHIREYKKDCILTFILVLIETACDLVFTITTGRFIDELANGNGSMEQVYLLGGRLLLILIVILLVGSASGWLSMRAAAGLSKNLRNGMFDHIQEFSFSNIEHFSAESLVTRMTTDVMNVQHAMFMLLRVVTKSPITLICGLVMAFSINWKLGLIYLIAIPILSAGLYLIASKALPLFPKIFRLYDKLNNVVRENLSGIRVVKSFVREDHETEKFLHVSGDLKDHFIKAECTFALNAPLMQAVIYICLTLIIWLASGTIIASKNGTLLGVPGMTTGQLQNLFVYGFMILSSLMMVSNVYVQLMMSQESVHRITAVLTEKADIENPIHPLKAVANGEIEFQDVGFSYAKDTSKLCLKGINLHIAAGETVGIIGGTGSAKSSLVQLIPRLYDATIGKVKVGGHDVKEYDIESLRDAVSMVLQKNVLFSGTIKENLRWGNENATDEELIHACKLAQADPFIQQFPDGYDTHIDQGGTNVSGGQKQRLCIARALLKKPLILILDDSTSAVDTKTDALIRQAFRDEIPNTTKIIIAQRISSVQDADKIIVMDQGEINAVGTHEELLANNCIYREVYESQQKGDDTE